MAEFGRPSTPITNTIVVTGTGKSSAVPNIANVSFTVQETAASVADAQTAATAKSDAALKALGVMGIAPADIQTTRYNVNPQYATTTCPPGVFCPATSSKITGYEVSQSVDVKVRDTGKAGAVLQSLGNLGVQNISGPNFTLDDTSSVKDAARALAIKDARTQAETLAKQLGVHLGSVVNYSESNQGPMPVYQAFGKAAALDAVSPSAPPTLSTGQNETNVTVTVTYEIR
jgi:hypothetical protein